jgi:tetratricopeptide (TPR) repeat protein
MSNRILVSLACVFVLCVRGIVFGATPQSESMVQEGNAAFKKGDRGRAIALFTEAAKVDPSNHVAFLNRGRIHESEGRYEDAIPDFDKVLSLVTNAAALHLRGASWLRLGHPEKALPDFDHYLSIATNQARFHWQRGIALYLLGRYDEGQKQFEDCYRAHTNDIEHVLWHFACTAKKAGIEQARASILPAGNDPRTGMKELYLFYAGKEDTNAVFAAPASGKQIEIERKQAEMSAHFYMGLFFDASGKMDLAQPQLATAAQKAPAGNFMGAVARSWRKKSS